MVSGTVTDAVSHSPLPGVSVEIDNAAGDYVDDTTTAADGTYSFAGLAAGTYNLAFDGSGAGGYPVQYYNGKSTFDSADPVEVAAGATVTGIDAALQLGGEIKGTVTAGAGGAGVAGIAVTAYDASGQPASSTATDSAGAYDLPGLLAGTYEVGFGPSQSGNYLTQFYPASASLRGAQGVQVTSRADHHRDRRSARTGRSDYRRRDGDGHRHADVQCPGHRIRREPDRRRQRDDRRERQLHRQRVPTGTFGVCFSAPTSSTVVPANVCFNGRTDVSAADPVNVTAGQVPAGSMRRLCRVQAYPGRSPTRSRTSRSPAPRPSSTTRAGTRSAPRTPTRTATTA